MPPAKGVCLFCQLSCYNGLKRSSKASTPTWLPQRRTATAMAERKRPARMTLSEDVLLGNRPKNPRQRPPIGDDGPFGGMNRTSPNIRMRDLNRIRSKLRAAPSDNKSLSAGVKDRKDRKDRPLFNALKMQTTLSPVSYSQREAIRQKIASLDKFEKFSLLPAICDAVYTQAFPGMTDIHPTPIQRLAIPSLVSLEIPKSKPTKQPKVPTERPKYRPFLLAAETGSGKTLAYLLPIIDSIKRQEVLDREEDAERQVREASERAKRGNPNELDPPELELSNSPHSTMGRPRAMIVLPTSELVSQVGALAKLMSHPIKYRSAPISSIYTPTVIRNRLFNRAGIDLIITTPHLISSIGENDPNIFSRVQNLVIDEADSLLDRSFAPTTNSIIDKCAPSLKNLILCSATIPKSLDSFLIKRFPDVKRLVTPKLHSIPRRVQLGVIDIDKDPYRGNRNLACADVIWSIGKAIHEDSSAFHTVKSMLVFVNEREKASEVASFLSSKGIDAVALTRDTSEARQREILLAFTATDRQDGEVKQLTSSFIPFDQLSNDTPASGGKNRLANTKVLVTTDLGSRGIDTLAVRHVILYDVPHTTIDFIHRLGRTGRMGRRGRGIVLQGKYDRKDIVREVREAMFKGQTLV